MYKNNYFTNFYIFIFIFWYSTEIIFNTTLKVVMGIEIERISNAVSYLIFSLLMIQIVIFQSYKRKELVIIIGITFPIIIATIFSGNRSLLSVWMFIVAAKNTNFDKLVRITYTILLIMVPIVVFLCVAGFLPDYIMMRGNIQRHSLGFVHPNIFGAIIFHLIMCHCYINKERLNIYNYCIIIFAIFFTIMFPNAQTTYICLILFLSLLFVYAYVKTQKQIIMKIYMKGLLIGAIFWNVFSISLSYIDVNKNPILSQIDRWLSLRFSFCHKVWLVYGVSFFGQRVYITEEERTLVGIKSALFLDNAYASILIRYGILVFLIFSVMYIYLIGKMIVKREYVLVIILFIYSLYGTMGPGLYMLVRNVFLLAFSDVLYHKTYTNMITNEEEFIGTTNINECSG